MKDPLGVSPSKRNQGTTRGKEKILLTSVGIRAWWKSNPRPPDKIYSAGSHHNLSLNELLSKKEIIWMNSLAYRSRLKKDL